MQSSKSILAQLYTLPKQWRNLRQSRGYLFALVTMLALLSATVAIGQSSQDFDLACRSIISSGNQTITNPGANFGVIATLGQPIAAPKDSDTAPTYSIRNTTHAVRTGFLPGYPTSQRIAIAEETINANAPDAIDQGGYQQRLPLLFKVARVVRGGC